MINELRWETEQREYITGWFTDESLVYGDATTVPLGGDGGIGDEMEFDMTGDGDWR